MMSDVRATLLSEIRDDPAGMGYLAPTLTLREGLGWHVLNTLRGKTVPGEPITRTRAVTKRDAANAIPGLIEAESAARELARTSGAVETYLRYYDDAPHFKGPAADAALAGLEGAGFSREITDALKALSEETVAGPPVSRLDLLGLGETIAANNAPGSGDISLIESILIEMGRA